MLTRIRRRLPGRGNGPWIVVAAVLVALLVTPFALAAGENRPMRGGARNPSPNASLSYTRETEIIANNNTYGTRQSNKSTRGGGAIYGCRSGAGGTPAGNRPCIRASNLAAGRAFEFDTNSGTEVGRIQSGNPNAAPFTTNATGVATGLNADRVDGKNASDIVTDAQALNKFAAVSETGVLGNQRDATSASRTAAGTYRVVFGSDVSKCALQGTVNSTAANQQATIGVALATANTVEVVTRDPATGTAVDRPTQLTVTC
jgi:hypothetical protein